MTSNINKIKDVWDTQYEGDDVTALKDQNLFKIETTAILCELDKQLPERRKLNILEIGCGTGELLRTVDCHLGQKEIDYNLTGIDFSENAIALAEEKSGGRIAFHQSDFLSFFSNSCEEKYDIIVSQRSIMALMDRESQIRLLESIHAAMNPNGVGIASECFARELEQFNTNRIQAGLGPIEKVWHSRYLEDDMFNSIFSDVKFSHFCSTYMLTTRILYPMFETPKHNQKIHTLAASLPESGDYSFLKLAVFER